MRHSGFLSRNLGLSLALCVLMMAGAQAAPSQPFHALTWDSDIYLPAGRYRAEKPIGLEGNFQIQLDPGVYLDRVEFHVTKRGAQKWSINGAVLLSSRIVGDLGTNVTIKDSILDDCVCAKGGGWFTSWWSTRWKFENSVISGAWFPGTLKVNDYSLVAKDCTFLGVKLPDLGLKEKCDYFQGNEMRIENCKFVRCVVPATFLAATVNCVFEQCQFPSQVIEWPAEALPIKVNAYYTGSGTAPSSFTKGPLTVSFSKVEDHITAGATLKFTQSGSSILSGDHPRPVESIQMGIFRMKKASEIKPAS